MSYAFIKLIINTDTFKEENGNELTPERLSSIADDVNLDAEGIYGYEGFQFGFENVEQKDSS